MSAFGEAEESDVLPLARQQDFDALMKELIETDGMSIEEAADEALATFTEAYNPASLFIYRNKAEMEEKLKVESNIKTIERASRGEDSVVNATFCFQGLRQSLGGTNASLLEGSWHMIEARGLFKTLLQMLKVIEKEEDEGEKAMGEDSDEDEDEDENTILLNVSVLDFTNFLLQAASTSARFFRDVDGFITVDEELLAVVKGRLDEDVGEPRVVTRLVPVLKTVLRLATNKDLFLAMSGVDLLELTVKMHKKNAALVGEIKTLIAALA